MRAKCLLANEDGVSLVEYALLIALIAAVAIIAVTLLGHNASSVLSSAAAKI